MGKDVPHISRSRPGGQHSSAEHQSQGQDLVEIGEAKANVEGYYDHGSGRQIESRVSVKQEMWEKHFLRPTSAVEEALKRTEVGAERAESSTAGGNAV